MNTKNCSTVNFLCSSFLGGLHVLSAMQFGRDDAAFSYICRSPRLKTKIPSNCQTKRVLYHWKNMYIFVGFRRWHQTKNESRVLFKRYHRKNMYIFAEQHQISFYKWCSFFIEHAMQLYSSSFGDEKNQKSLVLFFVEGITAGYHATSILIVVGQN